MATGSRAKRQAGKSAGKAMTVARDAVNRSWFGMTILQSRLLAIQVGLLLSAIGGIYKWYDTYFAPFYSVHPVLSWTIPGVLVVYILFFSVGRQAFAHYRQTRRDALVLSAKEPTSGVRHFRLDPYVTATPAEFQREDHAHDDVLKWISEATTPILFLSGVSGSGKSSVLEAYVLPLLQAGGWQVERIRALDDPLNRFQAAVTRRRPKGKRLLIVFDQFEEFVILEDRASADDRRAFVDHMRKVQAELPAGVVVLFSFRRDYMTDLVGLQIGELIPGRTYMEIDAFRRDAARRFLEKAPSGPAPALVDRLLLGAEALDDVPGRFRPVTLNMLGLALEEFDRQVTGRPERLVQGYMEAALAQPEVRETAPKVIEEMITDANTKQPRTVADLVTATGLRDRDVVASLILLERKGLVRRLDAVTQLWEISHDFVARQLAILLGRLRPSPWPRSAMFASLVLFTLVLGGAVFGVPLYLDNKASEVLGELGVSVTKRDGLQWATFAPETSYETLRNAMPHLIVKRVQALNLEGVQATELPSLQDLRLHTLRLGLSNLTTLPPLQELATLHTLDLSYSKVTTLPALHELKGLKALSLSYSSVTKITSFEGLGDLETLELKNLGAALPSLAGLSSLQTLDLSFARVAVLPPLRDLTALRKLDLSSSRIMALPPLEGLGALETLDLAHSRVTQLPPLQGLTSLQTLDLTGSQVTVLPPLPALRAIDLTDSKVTNLAPLKEVASLKDLRINGPLADDPVVAELKQRGVQVSDRQLTHVPSRRRVWGR